jgi:hypothetical protein
MQNASRSRIVMLRNTKLSRNQGVHRSRDPVSQNGWRHRRGPVTPVVRALGCAGLGWRRELARKLRGWHFGVRDWDGRIRFPWHRRAADGGSSRLGELAAGTHGSARWRGKEQSRAHRRPCVGGRVIGRLERSARKISPLPCPFRRLRRRKGQGRGTWGRVTRQLAFQSSLHRRGVGGGVLGFVVVAAALVVGRITC